MKFLLPFALVALTAPLSHADTEVSGIDETITTTSQEEITTISFSTPDDKRFLAGIETNVDTTVKTTDTVDYDFNDITSCENNGGVCGSNYNCFGASEGSYAVGFTKKTVKRVCAIDVTFNSANCGGVETVEVKINGKDLGTFDLEEKCACGVCDKNMISHTPATDYLAGLSEEAKKPKTTEEKIQYVKDFDQALADDAILSSLTGTNKLTFRLTGQEKFQYCIDRIVIDMHTACSASTSGDPHFKSWAGEHFEYHGQCDLVLAKVPNFAEGLGLDVHIRTKIVRYWSYIKNAVIRIGTDILEVEGSGNVDDWEPHYWLNYEYQGELSTIGGFPVKTYAPASAYKRTYEIDLGSKYPGQKIFIKIYKEFVRVDFDDASSASFGNAVGMLGDFKTGKTVARDGVTEMNDFMEYGAEWQVLPSEPKLFHEIASPQFPEKCIEPEDPRGERRRRLAESTITEAQAEAACASLKDPLDVKDCIYDVIATQDLDMVGAF